MMSATSGLATETLARGERSRPERNGLKGKGSSS
jgi:hypothetical protein